MLFKISRRNLVLGLSLLSGFYFISAVVTDGPNPYIIINNSHSQSDGATVTETVLSTKTVRSTTTETATVTERLSQPAPTTLDLGLAQKFPETQVIAHAPGWTLFKDVYMSAGALILLTSDSSSFPPIRLMTSTGLPGNLTNDAQRIPTERDMAFMSPEEARANWGGDPARGERNRILTVEGTTLLYNDPPQFLTHYFHFVAELIYGTWAFLYGAFSDGQLKPPASATADESFSPPLIASRTPTITRAIFMHSDAAGWRDDPGFNGYFMRAVFPSLTIETADDWLDRIELTHPAHTRRGRAWHFPLALLADRSAAFRGPVCGFYTQRTAAEAWMAMAQGGKIDLVGNWWASMRSALVRYAGGVSDEELSPGLGPTDHIVITYINRQGTRRHLLDEDNRALIVAMEELVERKNAEGGKTWEFLNVQAERLGLDEQVRIASRTTIMLGVHGNGLTHLVLMKPNRVSAVVEIFLPGGYARDYQWTSRSLGMRHYSIWNDTSFTYPDEPGSPDYPEGFHGTTIPVHAPFVSKVIEDHVAAREQTEPTVDHSPVYLKRTIH